MFKLIFSFVFLGVALAADQVTYVDYGGKIPQSGKFDVRFNFDADGARSCEVTLKKPSDNWKTYAYTKFDIPYARGSVKVVTLESFTTPAVGAGYVIEIKIFNGATQTGYYKTAEMSVESGKQGFHIYDGRLFDANGAEFLIRGINSANGDYDNYNRWWAKTSFKQISETGANTVRILWRKDGSGLKNTDLDSVIAAAIQYGLVPMIEMHDATGDSNTWKLNEMAQWLADNVWLLIKYRKYLLVNIANEWSPHGTAETKWRDAYKTAISIIRNAGFSGTLVVDASAYAQNPNGPKWYGNELLSSDSANNLLFSVHMYAEWSREQPNYNIKNELSELKVKKVPFIVGEFANYHPAHISGRGCVKAFIDADLIMSECRRLNFGYLGWSWAGNGNDGDCGSIAYLDISKQWHAHDYSEWGNKLIWGQDGIKATSKRATIF